jgi:hypothetical protein
VEQSLHALEALSAVLALVVTGLVLYIYLYLHPLLKTMGKQAREDRARLADVDKELDAFERALHTRSLPVPRVIPSPLNHPDPEPLGARMGGLDGLPLDWERVIGGPSLSPRAIYLQARALDTRLDGALKRAQVPARTSPEAQSCYERVLEDDLLEK